MNFISENPVNEGSVKAPDALSDETQRHERAVNAFEYAAWHLGVCLRPLAAGLPCLDPGVDLSGAEASILHIIHLNGTPKGLAEIARLLHRDDLVNLQYGLKKLLSHGFIAKADDKAAKKSMMYRTSGIRRLCRRGLPAEAPRHAAQADANAARHHGGDRGGGRHAACHDRPL